MKFASCIISFSPFPIFPFFSKLQLYFLQSALKEMISRDSFCASEVDIFRAVCEWAQQNPDVDMADILSAVRLPLMALPELLNVVRPTGLVSADTILDAIKARTESRDTDLKYRGYLSKFLFNSSVKKYLNFY